jgi:hypothetical protein
VDSQSQWIGAADGGRARVEQVRMPDGKGSWAVVRANGIPVEPVARFLAYLGCLPRSPNTVVAYAYDLRAWVDFLDEQAVAWSDVEVDHLARFVRWLEQPASNVLGDFVSVCAPSRRSGIVLGCLWRCRCGDCFGARGLTGEGR